MNGSSWFHWLTERLAVAFVSGVAAILTLALYPVALLVLGRGAGGGVEFDLGGQFYSIVFSKVGVVIVIAASVAGFYVGSERMANIFSFFWGTHSCWARLGAYLNDKLSGLQEEYNVPLWLLVVLLAILVVGVLAIYA